LIGDRPKKNFSFVEHLWCGNALSWKGAIIRLHCPALLNSPTILPQRTRRTARNTSSTVLAEARTFLGSPSQNSSNSTKNLHLNSNQRNTFYSSITSLLFKMSSITRLLATSSAHHRTSRPSTTILSFFGCGKCGHKWCNGGCTDPFSTRK
jgi:hypothetical protein